MGALDNLKVLDLSRLLPGPFCTTILADHGADVLVMEAPKYRHGSVLGNIPSLKRNKKHISVDLHQPEGRHIFFELLSNVDVLVEGFKPGSTKKWGIDYESLRLQKPDLIYCSITAFGASGLTSMKSGHDLNLISEAGLLDLIKDSRQNPVMPDFQTAALAGGVYAVIGILMALNARHITGRGQFIDTSMADSLVSLLTVPITCFQTGNPLPGRRKSDSNKWLPCYRLYMTKDGRYLSVGALEPHLWATMCEKLDRPDLVDIQYNEKKMSHIESELERIFFQKDLSEWMELLNDADACVSPVNSLGDVIESNSFRERGIIHMNTNGMAEPGVLPFLSNTPGSLRTPAYRFGEHTKEILTSINYSVDDISNMRDSLTIWFD